jgi:hypothetical protein
MIMSDGIANFLGWGQSVTRHVPSGLAPRPRESGRLPEQASHRIPPRCSETLVLAHKELPKVITTGSKAKHSERVCWNSQGWVHT